MFVGVSTGGIDGTAKISLNGRTITSGKTGENLKNIHIGVHLDKNNRLQLTKSFVESEENCKIDILGLSFIHKIDMNGGFAVLLGSSYSNLDYMETDLKKLGFSTDSVQWITSIVSLDIGFEKTILAENLNLNAGYQLEISSTGEGTVIYYGYPVKLEYENMNRWHLGLTYLF